MRRTLWIVAAVLLVLAVAVFLRSKAPPEAARLLPESDGIIYVNLRPVHAFFRKEMKPPNYVPEYQQFIDATGVNPERDVDEVAIALHRMSDRAGPNGPVAYSVVLVGKKITGQRLSAWLEAHAAARESYAGHTVYSIPSDKGRIDRVAQIGYDMVAISNMPTPEQIHSMLDRHSTAAWPFAGSTMLRQHYHEVPMLPLPSLAWGVGQIGLPFSEGRSISVFGWSLPLEADSTIIASLTPALSLGSALNVKVVEIAPSAGTAATHAAALNVLLIMARGLAAPLADNPANNGLREFLKSAVVAQERDRVVITATLSHALFSGPAAVSSAPPDSSSGPTASK